MQRGFMPVLVVVGVVVLLGVIGGGYYLSQTRQSVATSYEECVKLGNQVMLSYPARCRSSDGRIFTQPLSPLEQQKLVPPTLAPSPTMTDSDKVSLSEKQAIDSWIQQQNLNQFGDPKDTAYIGGTPLFNEMTGETVDRYQYILKNHPERPWNN